MNALRVAVARMLVVVLVGQLLPGRAAEGGPPEEIPSLTFEDRVLGAAVLPRRADRPPALVVATVDGLLTHRWSSLAAGSSEPEARLELGDRRTLAWCVGEGGDVYAITDGAVLRWDGLSADSETILEDRSLRLPSGVYHAQFAVDIDGDGDDDLVLPKSTGLSLVFADGEAWRPGPVVRQRLFVSVDIDDPTRGPGEVGQSVRIPRFEVADQNGDGRPDLAFRDDDVVQFFWSNPDGSLPATPTFQLDLAEIREKLPARSRDLIDVGNLLAFLESQVSHVARDLNGDGAADLLLRQGRTVILYRGGKDGIDRSRAVQVLKTGGNLLAVFAVDDDGDGKDDLAMLRVSDVSLGQALLWLVAGGTLTFDLFVYDQEGDLEFARKPSRRRTLNLALPSVTSLIDQWESDGEAILKGFVRMPAAGDFDGQGLDNDVVRLTDERTLEVFLNVLGKSVNADPYGDYSRWKAVMNRFDRKSDDGELTVELREFIDWAPIPGREMDEVVRGRQPDRVIALGAAGGDSSGVVLYVVDVDGEGHDDVVVGEASDESGASDDGEARELRLQFVVDP